VKRGIGIFGAVAPVVLCATAVAIEYFKADNYKPSSSFAIQIALIGSALATSVICYFFVRLLDDDERQGD
jgi:hypothetical protein